MTCHGLWFVAASSWALSGQGVPALSSGDARICRQIAVLYNGPTASRTEWYVTQLTNLSTHHYNPFVSPDGQRVGYHRCRCLGADTEEYIPVLERHTTSLPGALHSSQRLSTTLLPMAAHASAHLPRCKHMHTFWDKPSTAQ